MIDASPPRAPGDRPAIDRPRAPAPELPALLQRPEHLPHRHLAHAGGHVVAHLPADGLGVAPRDPRLRGADPDVPPRSPRGRAGRPLGSLPRPPRHAGPRDDPVRGCSRRSRSPGSSTSGPTSRSASSRGSSTPSTCPCGRRWWSRWWRTARICPTPSRSTRPWSTPRGCSGPRPPGVLIAAVGEGWCFFRRRAELPRRDRLARAHADHAAPPGLCGPRA